MSRINTNVSSLIAQNNLSKANSNLQTSLQRLSTGLQINRGADNPSGLIVSERLRNQIQGLGQAVSNIERASNVIATTEGSLQEVNALLIEMKALIVEAANTGAFSPEEVEANQLQIDSAVESITRISNTTSFGGLKLLNGSLDYLTSGMLNSQITDASIYGVNFGANDSMPVNIEVLNSAETAQLYLSGNGTNTILSTVTLEIAGPGGVQVYEFASGTALSAVAFSINQSSGATEVTAVTSGTGMFLQSEDYGTDSFVSVRRIRGSDAFAAYDAPAGAERTRDTGEDVLALVNGSVAIGDGLTVSLNTSTLSLEVLLTEDAAQTTGADYRFDITGGGALYQIGGSVNAQQQVGFAIGSVAASRLGNNEVGFLSEVATGGVSSLISGNFESASEILDAAIDQVTNLRGRLGAFERNTLNTTMRSTQVTLENLTASESVIRDTDFATETAELTRAQILQQAGTSTLALANQSAQSVLSLLG